MNSSSGIAPSRDYRSTRPWSPATAFHSRSGNSRRERSTDDLLQYDGSPTRPQTLGYLVRNSLPVFGASKGAKKLGVRLGNWLTAEEARHFWQSPAPNKLKGKRDRAILAVLLGCGLRRRELADLDFTHLQQREEHWAIVDLIGKGGHIRTVPVPDWVKATIDLWAGKHWGTA